MYPVIILFSLHSLLRVIFKTCLRTAVTQAFNNSFPKFVYPRNLYRAQTHTHTHIYKQIDILTFIGNYAHWIKAHPYNIRNTFAKVINLILPMKLIDLFLVLLLFTSPPQKHAYDHINVRTWAEKCLFIVTKAFTCMKFVRKNIWIA